jgi:hypothetical protein
MPDEVSTETTETVKKMSDGSVKISVEKYNEMLEKIAEQKGTISGLSTRLTRLQNEPPVINRTVINKTAEMAAEDHRMWGGTLMGLGASIFVVGAFRYRAGRS